MPWGATTVRAEGRGGPSSAAYTQSWGWIKRSALSCARPTGTFRLRPGSRARPARKRALILQPLSGPVAAAYLLLFPAPDPFDEHAEARMASGQMERRGTRETASLVSRGFGLAVLSLLSWRVLARGVSFSPPGLVLGILDGANFIFHEAGHMLFVFFGDFLRILGGSLTQVAIPVVCTGYFVRQHQLAASSVTLFWTGESITNVAIYIADARLMALPLHGGDDVIHDWNYLLGRLHLVNHAESLGKLAFALGVITIFSALGLLALDLFSRWNRPAGLEGTLGQHVDGKVQ